MNRPTLWLLITRMDRPDAAAALATGAWLAEAAGVRFEGYLEARRGGGLFATTGSTVLAGGHHHQFNYLCAVFNVRVVLLGPCHVFTSSISRFGLQVLYRGDSTVAAYDNLRAEAGLPEPAEMLWVPDGPISTACGPLDLRPYLFPEIFFRQAYAFAASDPVEPSVPRAGALYLSEERLDTLRGRFPDLEVWDRVAEDDSYGTITARIANRWKTQARGVAFGDPAAMLGLIPAHCREHRVALYGPRQRLPVGTVQVSDYAESKSEAIAETARLAIEIGNPVVVGRQTCDGDIRFLSSNELTLKVMDPNRPPFPVVETVEHRWAEAPLVPSAAEPDDAQLGRWADEGRILATLLWHSGIMAHNEAMLHVLEVAAFTGLKMGAGVMAARYQTCPQLWEMLGVPPDHGGVAGLVEPLLYAGGIGSLWEVECSIQRFGEFCSRALEEIGRITGPGGVPRGYYGYLQSNLATLPPSPEVFYQTLESAGFAYAISTDTPGRNRVCYESDHLIAINQTPRHIYCSTPFLRVTTVEELQESRPTRPGWLVGALDAPVIAYEPYIWRHGSRFMRIVDWLLQTPEIVNATPSTVARYARLLRARGLVPHARELNSAHS